MLTSFFGGAFFNGEFFNTATATQTFGNLGFMDIGGEPEGVEEYKRKQARIAQDMRRAFYEDDDDEDDEE